MVKVGFIVEGNSDVIIIKQSKSIKFIFDRNGIEVEDSFIRNARGKSNLKKFFVPFYKSLIKQGVEFVFILVDQDNDKCPLETRNEIVNYRDNVHYMKDNQIFIVMIREMEAWFLADEKLRFKFDGNPEEIENPSDYVSEKFKTKSHVVIANRVKDKFSIERAAKNSATAKRF